MLEVTIQTTEKVIYEGKATSLIAPGESGVFELLSYHKPLLSRLITGNLILDNYKMFRIRRGILGFNHNKATVVVEE